MRQLVSLALAAALVAAGSTRAEDPDEGSIGVQIKVEDGKIVVVDTFKNSPAEKAGIKKDDVIVKVNDFKADDPEATAKEIRKYKPGEKIKVGIKRGDKDMTIEVTVGKRSEVIPKDKDK